VLLTLPALAPDIPPVIEFGSHNERHLRLALAMCRSGMLPDSVLARQRRSRFDSSALIKLIETGWLREIAPLFDFKAIPAQATLLIPNGEGMSSEDFIGDNGEPQCAVVFNAGQPNWFEVGSVMESLEARQKGLGRKALDVIDSALCRWCMPFTPSGAFEMAQMLYWQGESDEKGVLAEYAANGDDASDVWKRAEIFSGVADWVYDSTAKSPKHLSDRGFSRMAKQMAETRFGPLLGHLVRLNVLAGTDKRALLPDPPKEFQCTEPMAVLYWRENDNLGRVFDDYWQYESQGEQDPYLGTIAFSLGEQELSNALVRVRYASNMLKALDDVLVALDALNKSMREK
jgi:PRTRC genetic system protein F